MGLNMCKSYYHLISIKIELIIKDILSMKLAEERKQMNLFIP